MIAICRSRWCAYLPAAHAKQEFHHIALLLLLKLLEVLVGAHLVEVLAGLHHENSSGAEPPHSEHLMLQLMAVGGNRSISSIP